MPYLNQIVVYINQQLRAVSLKGNVFQQGRFYGLAVSLPRGTDTLPCVVGKDDENTWVGIDETVPFIIYHKNNGILTQSDDKVQTGSGNIMKEVANFSMIIFSNRQKINATPEDVYAAIVTGTPLLVPKDIREPWKIRMIAITDLKPNFNSPQIYSQEYKSQEYQLKPNDIFFSVDYKIESRYDKTCFDINNCNC